MRYYNTLSVIIVLILSSTTWAGTFIGEPVLYPEGCQQIVDQDRDERKCKIEGLLTYISDDGLTWQIDEWENNNVQSGLTDGASIPHYFEGLVGGRYDKSYLKAAIIHDHYCYEENRVRTWRQTHRMFYDALIDLNVNKVKAKAMYFAVYWKGPRWEEFVAGEPCTGLYRGSCLKTISSTNSRYDDRDFDEFFSRAQNLIERNPDIPLSSLEIRADMLNSRSPSFYPSTIKTRTIKSSGY